MPRYLPRENNACKTTLWDPPIPNLPMPSAAPVPQEDEAAHKVNLSRGYLGDGLRHLPAHAWLIGLLLQVSPQHVLQDGIHRAHRKVLGRTCFTAGGHAHTH